MSADSIKAILVTAAAAFHQLTASTDRMSLFLLMIDHNDPKSHVVNAKIDIEARLPQVKLRHFSDDYASL